MVPPTHDAPNRSGDRETRGRKPVTGDSLAQVASQTLTNMSVIAGSPWRVGVAPPRDVRQIGNHVWRNVTEPSIFHSAVRGPLCPLSPRILQLRPA